MSAFRNNIGFNMDQAKIAQELADHMVNGKNPLNINPLVNTADEIYAEYMPRAPCHVSNIHFYNKLPVSD